MVLSNGTKRRRRRRSGLITKNSGLRRFDETVCTAPLGPISHIGRVEAKTGASLYKQKYV